MATAETVEMGPEHPPKQESIDTFNYLLPEIKKQLQHLRLSTDKHETQYFEKVSSLSNEQLTAFTSSNLVAVRVATSAYGLHLFGKVELPESPGNYIMFRAFIAAPGDEKSAKLHCIHMEEKEKPGSYGDNPDKDFRAIFGKGDKLEWFDV